MTMKCRSINNSNRDKAFLGALIGAAGNLIGGIIGARKQKKFQEREYRQNQIEQTRADGVKQAAAMSEQYANQDYVDQYMNKVTLKNGGKVNMKNKYNDRIAISKKFACGGRKKANLGSEIANDFKGNLDNTVTGAASGLGSVVSTIMQSSKPKKMIRKSDGFSYGAPKTDITPNSYNSANTNVNVNDGEYLDRLSQARMGCRKKAKCKKKKC